MKNKFIILMCLLFVFCSNSVFSQNKKPNPNLNSKAGSINLNAPVQKQTSPVFISDNNGPAFNSPEGYLVESFEGAIFPPANWTVYNILGPTYTWARATPTAHSGVASAFIRYDAVNGGGQDWLISPKRSIVSGDSVIFWMKLAYQGYQPDSLSVKVSPQPGHLISIYLAVPFRCATLPNTSNECRSFS